MNVSLAREWLEQRDCEAFPLHMPAWLRDCRLAARKSRRTVTSRLDVRLSTCIRHVGRNFFFSF